MRRTAPRFVLLVVALAPAVAVAQVYKCTEPDGRKVYQDQPCRAHQQASTLDPASANVTTIDSEAARREAQGALLMREAARPRRPEPPPEADDDDLREPAFIPVPVYPPEPVYYPYPVDRDRHDHRHPHHHGSDGPQVPMRPDPKPVSRPPRRAGAWVPPPPTIREIAPRPERQDRRTSRDDR